MKFLKKKNYLTMIENAAKGENWIFRNLYVEENGEERDILNSGRLSCAVFASSILFIFKLIEDLHVTVEGVVRDMVKNGWQEISEPKIGAVLVWEKKIGEDDDLEHSHIGFYIDREVAVSNDSRGNGFPHKHHYTYNDTRKIEKIYWHPQLDD